MTQRNVLPRGASVTDYYNIYTNGVCQIGDNTTDILTNFTPSTDSASLGIKGNVNCVGISTDVSGSSTGTYYSNSCTALRIPADTSANRPPTGLKGYIRYNTDTNDVEYYNGGNSSWENIAPATPTLDQVLTAGNTSNIDILITDSATKTNTIENYRINIIESDSSNYGKSQFETNVNANGSGVSALMGVFSEGVPSFPYPAPNGQASIQATPTTASLSLSQSTPFSPSQTLTLDLNNLSHVQSIGSQPFTVTTNQDLNLETSGPSKTINITPSASSGIGTINIPLSTNTGDRFIIEKTANKTDLYQYGGGGINTQLRLGGGGLRLVTINATPPSFSLDNASFASTTQTYSGTDYTFQLPQDGKYIFRGGGGVAGCAGVIINSGIGHANQSQLVLDNNNVTSGATIGVPSVEYYKSGRNVVATDVIGSNHFYAKNYTGTKTQFAKIEANCRNTGLGNDDGSIGFFTTLNGTMTEMFRINGADSENNMFLPLDMNGNDVKSSSGNMSVSTASSTGTGNLSVIAKGTLQLSSNSDNVSITNNTTLAVNKIINMSKSGANVYQGYLGADLLQVSNLTTGNYTNHTETGLTIQDSSLVPTYYSKNGFFNSDNSIYCNSSNGFILNYGSSTNKTTLDLTKLEIFNGSINQDTILLQNVGGGNPVINLQSYDGSAITNSFGASTQGFGVNTTNSITALSRGVSINNPTNSPATIAFNNNSDVYPMTISSTTSLGFQTNNDLILDGLNIISGSSGGASGQFLRILLNGNYYKIRLEDD
jgi:hypothetical protein